MAGIMKGAYEAYLSGIRATQRGFVLFIEDNFLFDVITGDGRAVVIESTFGQMELASGVRPTPIGKVEADRLVEYLRSRGNTAMTRINWLASGKNLR